MMLFIFHSLTRETRLTQLKKLFLVLEHAPKDPTPFHRLVLARVALMAAYMVDHIDEMAPDLLEEVRHVLLARTITTKASTDVELPFFLSADARLVAELRAERAAATRARRTSSHASATASPTAPRRLRSLRS